MYSPNYLLVIVLAFGLLGCQREPDPPTEMPSPAAPPNILWLVAEDISPRFAAYGDSLAHTPTIDALARRGIVFENAFTTSGVCAPSRSSLITGMSATSIGTQHMRQQPSVIPMPGPPAYNAVPPPYVRAFPELLREAGYWTASYTKLDYQFGAPFTIWDSVSYTPSWRDRPAEEQDRPWFVYNTFEITHEINIWPDSTKERFFEEFGLDTSTLAPDVLQRPPFDTSYAVRPGEVKVPPYLPDTEVGRQHIARLYDNASRMDRQIATIMADLEEDGLADNTIIFFLSDHGDCLPRGKRWVYDSGTHIPLVIYLPERYRRLYADVERDDRMVSGVDLAPTVLELTGVPVPDWMQGRSLLSAEPVRKYVFAGRDRIDNRYDTRRAVRDQQFKYIRNYLPEVAYSQYTTFLHQMPYMRQIVALHEAGKLPPLQAYWQEAPKPVEELYDIVSDPHEIDNLAADPAYAAQLTEYAAVLADWQEANGDYLMTPETEQAEAMWPGLVQPVTEAPWAEVRGDSLFLSSATEGASIAYRRPGERRWRIYTGPVAAASVEGWAARAVRYGYAASPVVRLPQ